MDIKSETSEYGVIPNKALGQNFLADENAIASILDAAQIDGRNVLEIGPGLGALTRGLKERCKRLMAVEIDGKMVDVLRAKLGEDTDLFRIVKSDFLKVDYKCLTDFFDNDFSAVANLPYYVTTPVVMRLLLCPCNVSSMTLMMQKEAAEHFTARPNTKLYSPASVLSEYLYTVDKVLELSPASYYPQPDVNSVVLRFTSRGADREIVPDLYKVLSCSFAMRRKTLANNLAKLGFEKKEVTDMLAAQGFDAGARAEQLNMTDFLETVRIYRNKRQK